MGSGDEAYVRLPPHRFDGPVGRPPIDHDDLAIGPCLGTNAGERRLQHLAAIKSRNDDRKAERHLDGLFIVARHSSRRRRSSAGPRSPVEMLIDRIGRPASMTSVSVIV